MACIQNITFVLLLATAIYIESPPFSTKICPTTLSICGPNIVENGANSCKLESYSGGKTWQSEMGSPCRNLKNLRNYWTNSAEICRTYRHWHGVLVDRASWLLLKIWWRQAADKIYILHFSEIRISNNFEDRISKKSSKQSWCLWPSNSTSHLALLHLVMKLLNKNKKRPYFANFIFEPEQSRQPLLN